MIDIAWLQQILNKIGKNDDAASMSDTLFAGQQSISDAISGLSMLGSDEKAMLGAERFGQVPIFETWDGAVDENQIVAPGIDDLTLMNSRHPWATAWLANTDGASFDLKTFGDRMSMLRFTVNGVSGKYAQVGSLRGYRINSTGLSYFAPKNERLIFELIVKPEDAGDTNMDWFVGFANNVVSTALTTPELVSYTTTRRWGFAIDGDTNIYRIACDNNGTEVTSDHDLTSLSTLRYLKAIYDVGTNIKFYVDNTLIGTLSTRLPVSQYGYGTFFFFFYVQTNENNNKEFRNYFMRSRWQNGATP